MHDSTADLFINHEEGRDLEIDEIFTLALEERAAELEITVDYYMAEFM